MTSAGKKGGVTGYPVFVAISSGYAGIRWKQTNDTAGIIRKAQNATPTLPDEARPHAGRTSRANQA